MFLHLITIKISTLLNRHIVRASGHVDHNVFWSFDLLGLHIVSNWKETWCKEASFYFYKKRFEFHWTEKKICTLEQRTNTVNIVIILLLKPWCKLLSCIEHTWKLFILYCLCGINFFTIFFSIWVLQFIRKLVCLLLRLY